MRQVGTGTLFLASGNGVNMPKLFPIHLEVEELAVGRVMRQLHNTPGVAKINLDMGAPSGAKLNGHGEPAKPRGPYKPRKTFEKTGKDFILELLQKGPMTTAVVRDHFGDVGRSINSVSSQLFSAQKAGEIQHNPEGAWALTKKMKDRLRHRKSRKTK